MSDLAQSAAETGGYETSAEVAIVGSGFAGSLTALALRRLGRSVVLLERGRHPRFAIGESSTPLANLLIEELADRYGLDRIRPLSKWGTWQRAYPQIGCGLKRGFSFFRHDVGRAFSDDERHERQLLVAASPHDEIADTHWYRPDVDAFLAEEARAAGAEYLDETTLQAARLEGEAVVLEGLRQGRPLRVRAAFVIDASGPRGFLHRVFELGELPLRWLPPTQTLYSHFERVGRFEATPHAALDAGVPFPVDEAAQHHVFPGGWMWVLRFANGITSAGVAVTDDVANEWRLQEDGAWGRVVERLPSVRAQFSHARPIRSFVHAPRLAFRSQQVIGPRWALLPSAAGVIDPLLSTGFPLTLLGLQRLLPLFEDRMPDGMGRMSAALADYESQTIRELDATEQLVGALYRSMHDFERFKQLALLYFAAASYTETARRLGRPDRARGFLLCDDPQSGPAFRACTEAVTAVMDDADRRALFERVDRAIAPLDVAGLRDRSRRSWYPVRAEDLLSAAPRLDASVEELELLLQRCGFAPATSALPVSH
jgi:tetracycline 7-halogenase / FADH2 O2-dependent halogenase